MNPDIDNLITKIRKKLNEAELPTNGLSVLMPKYTIIEINRKKYKGIGRPKKGDYIMKKTTDILKEINEKRTK